MSEIQKVLNLIRGGGVGSFQKVLKFKKFWIIRRGGGSSLIGNFSQIFPFFLVMAPLTMFICDDSSRAVMSWPKKTFLCCRYSRKIKTVDVTHCSLGTLPHNNPIYPAELVASQSPAKAKKSEPWECQNWLQNDISPRRQCYKDLFCPDIFWMNRCLMRLIWNYRKYSQSLVWYGFVWSNPKLLGAPNNFC